MYFLTEPLSASYLIQHMRGTSHEFSYQEIEGMTTGKWGSLYFVHRGDHEGRDQDHVHEV